MAYIDKSIAGIQALQVLLDEAKARQEVNEDTLANAKNQLEDVISKRKRRAKGGGKSELSITFIAICPLTCCRVSS